MNPWIFAIVVRLLVPLFIVRYPWWGMVAALVLDAFDLELIKWLGVVTDQHVSFAVYQRYDKWFDIYLFTIALIPVFKFWDAHAKRVGVFLYAWRLIGVVAFEFSGLRWLLMLFPNVFEFFYLYVSFRMWLQPGFAFASLGAAWLTAAILLIPKLVGEYHLHINKAAWISHIKHDILGWPRTPFD